MNINCAQHPLRIGTRRSQLAKKQTQWISNALKRIHPSLTVETHDIIATGDKIAESLNPSSIDNGFFVKEIEHALIKEQIDLAVHSLKDLPVELSEGLQIGAIPCREDPHDVWLTSSSTILEKMPSGASIGTSSLRRKFQLLHYHPELQVISIRGNIDTRLQKMERGDYSGLILAAAGLIRLNWQEKIQQYLPYDRMIPAAGQGALALETRANDRRTQSIIAPLHDIKTDLAIQTERHFLQLMGGGCQTPMTAFCQNNGNSVVLRGFCVDDDGHNYRQAKIHGDWKQMPLAMAEQLVKALE